MTSLSRPGILRVSHMSGSECSVCSCIFCSVVLFSDLIQHVAERPGKMGSVPWVTSLFCHPVFSTLAVNIGCGWCQIGSRQKKKKHKWRDGWAEKSKSVSVWTLLSYFFVMIYLNGYSESNSMHSAFLKHLRVTLVLYASPVLSFTF